MNNGRRISTDTVQAVAQAELMNNMVKEQIQEWKVGTEKFLNAKSNLISWADKKIPRGALFDLENKNEEFLRNFNIL